MKIQRSIERTKLGDFESGDDDETDNEKPPPSRIKARPGAKVSTRDSSGGATSGGQGRNRSAGGRGSKKLSKREESLVVPPLYTTVDLEKYDDEELFGKQGLASVKQDSFSATREVLRAVLTKNHKLLKKLTTDKSVYKGITSFKAARSADIQLSPLQYAIEADDVAAASMLVKAREIGKELLAKEPTVSLPSHSTGKHTSAFSDYNRRAINASRGGKEGNNALMSNSSIAHESETQTLWGSKNASLKMLTLLYPTGDWTNDWQTPHNVGRSAKVGNYKFVAKLIETLSKNGGWGFNELHYKVLSDTNEDLPAFRAASAIKMATQTRIRPLHLAAINPNTKYLKALWDSAGNEWSAAKDTNGYEPIHFAAACEGTGPLKFLLENRVSLFARTKSRETPMIRAIVSSREENAILMLDHAAEEDAETVSTLVTERGPSSRQPIHYAAQENCPRVIEKLLQHGAEINSAAADKMTPLCYAAQKGHLDCVKLLLEHGAKVDAGDKLKKTPLMYAVKNGHVRVAALLINHGANVNAYDTSENSVVHYAASFGWNSCLQLLADAGADFWVRNSWGFVPLICALLKQRLTSTEFILEHDVDKRFLDYRDRDGCTMLFLQCKHSTDASQIQYLLEKGLNPDICDSENEYPLQLLIIRASLAQENSNHNSSNENASFFEESIRLLLKHGAQSHYVIEKEKITDDGKASDAPVQWQPLQLAMKYSLKSIFVMLLSEFNADPDAPASNGADAWTVAASLGGRGDYYLEALLKHHSKKHKGKKLELSAREGAGYKDNFFHIVGQSSAKDPVSPVLVRQCIEGCVSPTKLMNEKDFNGQSPLLVLLRQERKVQPKLQSASEMSDYLEACRTCDAKYCELVALFAESTTSAESFVRFVTKNRLAGAVDDKVFPSEQQDADKSEDRSNNEDKSDDDKSGSESESGSESDSGSGSGNVFYSASANKSKLDKTSVGHSNDDGLKLVKFETALQLAANRRLTCEASDVTQQWFGKNLINILFEKKGDIFDAETVNFPEYTSNKTALQYAVEASDVESTRILLASGADPNISPFRCEVCQAKALASSDEQCVSSCGKELIETALFTSVQKGHLEITKLLLAHGANVMCFEQKTLDTPLHVALGSNNADITKELLAHGGNLSKRNASGAAPLHFAVHAKHSIPETELHQDEVKYTEVDASTASSATTSSLATRSAIQVALQDKKASHAVILKDSKSLTPIHLAAANRDLALLRDLVKASSDKIAATNIRDEFGRTPLHYAVNKAKMSSDASFEVERFLLQSGADANLVDQFGFAPLHFALLKVDFNWHKTYDDAHREKNAEQMQQDRDAGAYEEKRQQAFLQVLAQIPSNVTDPVETVSNLVSVRGINIMLQDALGRSPLHLAAATGAFVCVSMLVSACAKDSEKMKLLALKDKQSFTALGLGVLHLRQTSIMTLLQNGADVQGTICIKTWKDESDLNRDKQVKIRYYSYFYHAVKHSLTGICHMLLTAKFCHRQAVEDAVSCGQFQLAYNLMIGTEVSNDSRLLTRVNDRKETVLHTLAKVNKPFDKLARTIAWTLVDAGVKPSHRNENGNTALHYAAKTGNIHLMDFLLHNKSDVNQVNDEGETPLLYAMKRSKLLSQKKAIEVLKYLMTKPGFDIHATDKSGMNILTAFLDRFVNKMSTKTAHFVWIEKLLKKGVDPNGMFASMARTDLFANKALADSSTTTKMPALVRMVYAPSAFARYHSIALLLQYGAKITSVDENGNSLLMHLVAKNLTREVKLALGLVKRVPNPTASQEKKIFKSLHITAADVKNALAQTNDAGQTALHFAVKPFEFESYENVELVKLLVDAGASIRAKDAAGHSVLDYTRGQSSRFIFRFLKQQYPTVVTQSEEAFFGNASEDEHMFDTVPDYSTDAREYLLECERNGKIQRKRVDPQVNENCDVGKVKRVYSKIDSAGELIKGEEYDALLTKVDVKNGRFGLNVFYRLQLVQDEIQGIFIVFTNWGRIGETGKFQNTPFHSSSDAVAEFKKIFRSKTGNQWDERDSFTKQSKKYNLVQRVNTHTKVDRDVTASFTEVVKEVAFPAFTDSTTFSPSVVKLLGAITDIHNLELAATESCDYKGGLPLAKEEELQSALEKLLEIRVVIEERDEVSKSITEVNGNMTEESASSLTDLSEKYNELTEQISEKSSRYYEVMPCNEDAFGSSIRAFDSVPNVNKEITRLRLLVDIVDAYKMLLGAKRLQNEIHPLEYCYNAMQVRLVPMGEGLQETELLKKYFFNGLRKNQKSRYKVANAFQVDRQGEKSRFQEFQDSNPKFKSKHSHLLWHGTRRTNLMGILSQGLRIAPPEAPHHGYMYGKGLYFADVAAKSVDYCGSPYKIKSTSVNKDGKTVETERTVFYMLLCEVSTGQATELVNPTFSETIPEGIESVKALSTYVPDPTGWVVSPESGTLMHLGVVGQIGHTIPIDMIWAKTEYNPKPLSWYENQSVFTNATQQILNTAIETLSVGETYTVEDEKKDHFMMYASSYGNSKKITFELVANESGDDSQVDTAGGVLDVGPYCDATIKVLYSGGDLTYSYTAKRYRNMFTNFPLERGYTLQRPNLSDYSEYIVYNEAQARIRYLLEIEQV